MLGGTGEEGGGFGLGPVFVAGAVVGREGVSTGSARLVVDTLVFCAGGNDQAEGGSVGGAGDAGHATVAVLANGGKIE